MSFKKQLERVKDNWLLILLVLIAGFYFLNAADLGSYESSYDSSYGSPSYAYESASPSRSGAIPMIAEYDSSYSSKSADLAAEERLKITTASLSTEVESGKFDSAEAMLKSVVKSSDALLLDENVMLKGTEDHPYSVGSYEIKVEAEKFDSVADQLKEIGKLTYFTSTVEDVTEKHTDLSVELSAEKERLSRYLEMYEEAKEVDDKIDLNDRIFNQERLIKYYEKRLANLDNEISYSTIHVTITEKQSGYADIAFVAFSALLVALLTSLSALLLFLFGAAPWVAAVLIVWLILRFFKKRR